MRPENAKRLPVDDKSHIYLLHQSIDDWVKKDHLVRFTLDCLGAIDLTKVYDAYSTNCKHPIEPRHMLWVLIYAYSKDMRSSRLIAKACKEDLPFRWTAGNLTSKHTALCRFRVKHTESFKVIFLEALRICAVLGALSMDKLILDCAKIKAAAAAAKQAGSARAQSSSTDHPEYTSDSDAEPPPADPPKLTGNKAKANITDPDSRIMKMRRGYVQGYSAQIVVTEDQSVVAAVVVQDANDVKLLESMLERALSNLEAVEAEKSPKDLGADAGYWKESLPVEYIEERGPELFIATKKDWKQRKELRERGAPRGRPRKNLSRRHWRRRWIDSPLSRSWTSPSPAPSPGYRTA